MDERKKKIFRCFFYLFALFVVISAGVLVLPVYRQYEKQCAELAILQAEYASCSAECIQLHKEVNDLETKPEAVEKVAREKFKLCREGELVLRYGRSAK